MRPSVHDTGLASGAVTAATLALLQDRSSPEQFGVATSSATLLRNVGAAVGINAVAALAAHAGAGAFWLLVAVVAVTVLPAALTAPRSRAVDA